MRGQRISYTAAELAWLEANRLLPIADYHRAFQEAFRRPEITAANLHALRKRKGWKTGRTGRFEPGHVSANKGQRCAEGKGGRHPNARRTQFRKGCARSGRAAEVYKPIGTERLSESGYLERKIHDGMPLQSRWRAVHLIEWEKAHGPIPKGYCLKCRDGQKTNVDPSNWELIPRAVLAMLNRASLEGRPVYDEVEAELRPSVLATAKLRHQVNRLRAKGRRS